MKEYIEHIHRAVDSIVARRGTSVNSVIPILQDIQHEFNHLPEEALLYTCTVTDITLSLIHI